MKRSIEDFGTWLAGELRARNISQRQLGQRAGVSHSTISRLLAGDRLPSLRTVVKLMQALPGLAGDAEYRYLGPTTLTREPTVAVRQALASDDLLTQQDVLAVMNRYLELRRQAESTEALS